MLPRAIQTALSDSDLGRYQRLRKVLVRSSLAAVGLVMLGAQLRTFAPATIDDAYISYRYGEHWAQGLGLTFNPGERVEGFSNFLWVALLALAAQLGLDVIAVSKVLGVAGLLGLITLAVLFLRRAGYGQFAPGAALALLLISNGSLVFLSISGLETVFFAALLMAALYNLQAHENRLSPASAALLLAVALTRPEGIAYLVCLGPVAWWLRRRTRPGWGALWWAAALLGYGAFLAWRWQYFANLVPNTFYAKPSAGSQYGPLGLAIGSWLALPELAPFLMAIGGPFAAGAALVAATGDGTRRRFLPLTAVVLVGFAFQAYSGQDWMQLGRFLMPVAAPLATLGVAGWQEVAGGQRARYRNGALALIAGVCVLLNLSAAAQFWEQRERYPGFVLTSGDMITASRWIGEHYPASYSIVCWRIGALGYYGKLKVIDDTWGLTDATIARLVAERQLNESTRDQYLAARNPELVMKQGLGDAAPPDTVEVGGRGYRLVRRFPQGSDEWWDLYERADVGQMKQGQ